MKLKYISYLALVFRKFAWLMKSAVIQKCKRTFLKKYKKKLISGLASYLLKNKFFKPEARKFHF